MTSDNRMKHVEQYQVLIDFARQKNVKRWNGRCTLNNYNLLDHSARVANICRIMCQIIELNGTPLDAQLKLHIMEYALYHDYAEIFMNDTPTPIKQKHVEFDAMIKSIEKEIMQPLILPENKLVAFIVKLADIIDVTYEALSEIKLGAFDIDYIDVANGDVLRKIVKYSKKNDVNLDEELIKSFINVAVSMIDYLRCNLSRRD